MPITVEVGAQVYLIAINYSGSYRGQVFRATSLFWHAKDSRFALVRPKETPFYDEHEWGCFKKIMQYAPFSFSRYWTVSYRAC